MNFTDINICIIVIKDTITNIGVLMKQKIIAFYHFKDPVELMNLSYDTELPIVGSNDYP